jgi:hypothetical protein
MILNRRYRVIKGGLSKFKKFKGDLMLIEGMKTITFKGDFMKVVTIGMFNGIDSHNLAVDLFVV